MTAPIGLEALRAALSKASARRFETGLSASWNAPIAALVTELTTRRARDAEAAVLIASELARIDGYEPEDENGGLYDLRWSGGPNPEPEGDAWHMDYLPKGERIAAALANLAGGQSMTTQGK